MALNIPKLNIRRLGFVLNGETSFISNRPTETAIEAIEKNQTEDKTLPKTAKVIRPPKEPLKIFMEHLYLIHGSKPILHDEDTPVWAEGSFGFPSSGFKLAMVEAGFRAGETKAVIGPAVFVEKDLLEILCEPGPIMRRDLVHPQWNKTDLAYRPEFIEWKMEPVVRYNADIITAEHVVNMVYRAGETIGIGSWKPEHGRFSIESVEEL